MSWERSDEDFLRRNAPHDETLSGNPFGSNWRKADLRYSGWTLQSNHHLVSCDSWRPYQAPLTLLVLRSMKMQIPCRRNVGRIGVAFFIYDLVSLRRPKASLFTRDTSWGLSLPWPRWKMAERLHLVQPLDFSWHPQGDLNPYCRLESLKLAILIRSASCFPFQTLSSIHKAISHSIPSGIPLCFPLSSDILGHAFRPLSNGDR
jgi:hypothetical protein